MIDLAGRPLDPDAVLASLGPYARRETRVVTVGDDFVAFISLRHAMVRQGMSASMAWSAKQAAELLPMVRPEVVVIDLELPAREICGIVVRLASSEPVPSAILVRGTKDPALAFAAALAQATHVRRTVPLHELLTRVLRVASPGPPDIAD